MELNFYSLSSGSSGNCYYLGNGQHGILIDAGIPGSAVIRYLKMASIPVTSIKGILVTHNHTDHTRGLEYLTRRCYIPVFTTSGVRKSILSPKNGIAAGSIGEIAQEQIFHLAGFDIVAFPVSHDAPETVGFNISSGDKTITIVTDLGYICPTSSQYIRSANLLVIESNYDEEMLLKGKYPWFLKNRIRSDKGHLGNQQVSDFLAGIIGDNLRHICLAHLSNNNNTPELALQTLNNTLAERGITLNGNTTISVLNRHIPSEIIKLT